MSLMRSSCLMLLKNVSLHVAGGEGGGGGGARLSHLPLPLLSNVEGGQNASTGIRYQKHIFLESGSGYTKA